jgi:hypothetical protein
VEVEEDKFDMKEDAFYDRQTTRRQSLHDVFNDATIGITREDRKTRLYTLYGYLLFNVIV